MKKFLITDLHSPLSLEVHNTGMMEQVQSEVIYFILFICICLRSPVSQRP